MAQIIFSNFYKFECFNFLSGLMQNVIERRLGCRGSGAAAKPAQPWFNQLPWSGTYTLMYLVFQGLYIAVKIGSQLPAAT